MTLNQKFLIKTEASRKVGFGHVRRLIRLAKGLEEKGAQICFCFTETSTLTKNLPFSTLSIRDPQSLETLSSQYPVIILDEPRLPDSWLSAFNQFQIKIGIDELGPARDHLDLHFCTTLLGLENREDYRGKTREYIGPKYFLFPEHDPGSDLKRDPQKILVTMGGTDPGELCEKFFQGLYQEYKRAKSFQWHSILGPGYPPEYKNRLRAQFPGVHWLESQTNMNQLYASSLAVICCGGITPYEALKQGCFPILIAQMQEQTETALSLHNANLGFQFGDHQSIDWERFRRVLDQNLEEMRSLAHQKFCDLIQSDPTQRVIDIIHTYAKSSSL